MVAPKPTIFFPLDDGQDFLVCVLILPILCCLKTLGKVLLAMPFSMFLEVIAFCLADFEPLLQLLHRQKEGVFDSSSPVSALQIAQVPDLSGMPPE